MSLPPKALIVGWYGTETVGDKAILGGIISHYRRTHPQAQITVASIYPFITHRTLEELRVEARVISTYGGQFVKACATHDEVVMGGGPLMDLETLSIPLSAFLIARAFRRQRIVWGCGLGPLTRPRYLMAVRQILRLASVIKLRDGDSVAWGKQLSGRADITQIADPAKDYVLDLSDSIEPGSPDNVVACFLRDWDGGSQGKLSEEEVRKIKPAFERNLAVCLSEVCRRYDLRPVFYSMHTFTEGNDDRCFNRRFIQAYLPNAGASYDHKPSSVVSIIQAMQNARLCLCMRFHSVLFAHTLGRPYIALDYTHGGKIGAFLKDEQVAERGITLQELAAGSFDRWNALVAAHLGE